MEVNKKILNYHRRRINLICINFLATYWSSKKRSYNIGLFVVVFSAAHKRLFNILLYGLQSKCLWCCLVLTKCWLSVDPVSTPGQKCQHCVLRWRPPGLFHFGFTNFSFSSIPSCFILFVLSKDMGVATIGHCVDTYD